MNIATKFLLFSRSNKDLQKGETEETISARRYAELLAIAEFALKLPYLLEEARNLYYQNSESIFSKSFTVTLFKESFSS